MLAGGWGCLLGSSNGPAAQEGEAIRKGSKEAVATVSAVFFKADTSENVQGWAVRARRTVGANHPV